MLPRGLTDTASQTAQVVAANDDARFGVGRVLKLIEPISVLQDAAKHALVVAEEHKGNQTAYRDASLERLAPSEPGMHDRSSKICKGSLEKTKIWGL